jgi:hypothetical protein
MTEYQRYLNDDEKFRLMQAELVKKDPGDIKNEYNFPKKQYCNKTYC